MTESVLLTPGVTIKPQVNEDEISDILSEIFGLKSLSVQQLNGYDDNNYHIKVDCTWDNDNISHLNKCGYILKIVNVLDSLQPEFFEAQNDLLVYLNQHGICCPRPVKNKRGEFCAVRRFLSGNHVVRLLEYISGLILYQVPSSNDLFYQTGEYIARLDQALMNFHHPVYDKRNTMWMLESVPHLSRFLFVVADKSRKLIVEEVIEMFAKRVLSISDHLGRGMIHGDFNEQNILVEQKDGHHFIKAVLDFGDSQFSCYLYELAITMMYMMLHAKNLDVGGYVLAGYTSVRKLPLREYNLLKVCIAARLCQSLVLGAYSSVQDPNNSYVLTTAKSGWALLDQLWCFPEDKLLQYWKTFLTV